jgi:hypothetical protein
MKRFMNKKVAAIGLASALALGIAGGAFAFFTSSGAGNGTASVGTTGSNIAVEGTSTPALTPGNSATVTFTAYNYAAYNQAISNIHVTGVSACSVPFSAVSTASYASATTAPTCADSAAPLLANDAACAAGGVSSTAGTDWFSLPDVSVSPTGDGNLAANGHTTLGETGTVTMNDQDVNQDACEGLYLNFTFATS